MADETPAQETAQAEEQAATDLKLDEAQAAADVEQEDGYRGVKVDPTPNEHYTVSGVLAGKPTPETVTGE